MDSLFRDYDQNAAFPKVSAQLQGYIRSGDDPYYVFKDQPGAYTVPAVRNSAFAQTPQLVADSAYETASAELCHSIQTSEYADTSESASQKMIDDYDISHNIRNTFSVGIETRSSGPAYNAYSGSNGHAVCRIDDGYDLEEVGGGSRTDSELKTCTEKGCSKAFKTNAELKKHVNGHVRPHKCEVPHCRNKTGFASSYDLARHNDSCHRDPLTPYYRCPKCPFDKRWPRADNFRNHLQNVHDMKDPPKGYLVTPRENESQIRLCMGGQATPEAPSDPVDLAPGLWTMTSQFPVPFLDSMGGESYHRETMSALNTGPGHYNQISATNYGSFSKGSLNLGNRDLFGKSIASSPLANSKHTPSTGGTALNYQPQAPTPLNIAFAEPRTFASDRDETPALDDTMAVDDNTAVENNTAPNPQFDEPQTFAISLAETNDDHDDCGGDDMDYDILNEHCNSAQGQKELAVPEKTAYRDGSVQDKSSDNEQMKGGNSCDTIFGGSGTTNEEMIIDPTDELSQPEKGQLTNLDLSAGPLKIVLNKANKPEIKKLLEWLASDDSSEHGIKIYKPGAAVSPEPITAVASASALPEEHNSECKADRNANSAVREGENSKAATHKCPTCGKLFKTNAILKKHKKRHEKPFKCTFPHCRKPFGSKNDWKRHESGQHFDLETWKCQEKVATTGAGSASDSTAGGDTLCKQMFYLREEFVSHLMKHHSISDAAQLDIKASSCRSGHKYDLSSSFWCGFCRRVVEEPPNGGDNGGHADAGAISKADGDADAGDEKRRSQGKQAATETGDGGMSKGETMKWMFNKMLRLRFDHIDDHYVGRKDNERRVIDDWVEENAAGPPACDGQKHGDLVAESVSPTPSLQKRSRDEASEGCQSSSSSSKTSKKRKLAKIWLCCRCTGLNSAVGEQCYECGHGKCPHC